MSKGSFPSDAISLKGISTGDNSAGNGGNGTNSGNISNSPSINFNPTNKAEGADVHVNTGDKVYQKADWDAGGAKTTAYQTNFLAADMSQNVAAGIGGNGGSGNKAEGGDVHIKASIESVNLNDVLNHSGGFHGDDFVHV